jgi:hypothetical protein
MNKKLLFLPLIGCALLASCSEEGTNDANNTIELPKQAHGKTITFKAEPLSVETKSLSTKVDVIPNGNNDDLEWTDESVSFGFFDGSNIIFDDATVTPVFGGAKMDVTIPEDPGTYGVYAISPSGSYFTDNRATTTLTIDNQTQVGRDLSHLSPYVFLYSNPSTKLVVDENKNSTGDIPLSFDVLSSLIRFDIVNNSSTEVTLNSITIKFDGDRSLYKTVTLNDLDGTLTYNGVTHDEMTLTLNNASLRANASDPFSAYMAAFPSNGSGDLLIDLGVTANGYSNVLKYILSNTSFDRSQRSYIELDVLDSDIPLLDGSIIKRIGNNDYKTFIFETGPFGTPQLWMIEDSREGSTKHSAPGPGHYYDDATRWQACPAPDWKLPNKNEFTALKSILHLNPQLYTLYTVYYSGGYFGSSGTYNTTNYAWVASGVYGNNQNDNSYQLDFLDAVMNWDYPGFQNGLAARCLRNL